MTKMLIFCGVEGWKNVHFKPSFKMYTNYNSKPCKKSSKNNLLCKSDFALKMFILNDRLK